MSKAVLLPVQPYWVFLIIAKSMGWNYPDEKTIEVRKNYPKSEEWNRVVKLYCSKDKKSFNQIPKQYQPLMKEHLGKVVGEFVCDTFITDKTFGHDSLLNAASCMSDAEIAAYCTNKEMFGWHIANLKIYDKPKELSEFTILCKEYDKDNPNCECCDYQSATCDFDTPSQFDCKCNGFKPLTRPPQSWCYVEEVCQ